MTYTQTCPRCGADFTGDDNSLAADAVVDHASTEHRHTLHRDVVLAHLEGIHPFGVVFPRANGQPVHPHVLSQTFDRVQVIAGLPRIRLHDLRHTHATLLLKAGVPLKVVNERLGHSRPASTMTVYQHVLPGVQRNAARIFARLVAEPHPEVLAWSR